LALGGLLGVLRSRDQVSSSTSHGRSVPSKLDLDTSFDLDFDRDISTGPRIHTELSYSPPKATSENPRNVSRRGRRPRLFVIAAQG